MFAGNLYYVGIIARAADTTFVSYNFYMIEYITQT